MIDQTDKEAEYYRYMVFADGIHIVSLKLDNAQVSESYYKLIKRVEELLIERDNLRAQLNIQLYWDSLDS